jgi:hypothetical protein
MPPGGFPLAAVAPKEAALLPRIFDERLGAQHKPFAQMRLIASIEVADHSPLDSIDDSPGSGDEAPPVVGRMDVQNATIASSCLAHDPALSLEHNHDLVRGLLGEGTGAGELSAGETGALGNYVERRVLGTGDAEGGELALDHHTQGRIGLAEQERDVAVWAAEALANLNLSRHLGRLA